MNIKKWEVSWLLSCAVMLAAGCTGPDTTEVILVESENALHVASLEVTHEVDADERRFEMRAMDAAGDRVATVRTRIGVIDDLEHWLPGEGRDGSEITVSVTGRDTRMLTRERELVRIDVVDDLAAQTFLEIDEVSATLAREARIIVAERAVVTEVEANDAPYMAWSCWAGEMLAPNANTTKARQCCYGNPTAVLTAIELTRFVNDRGAVVRRDKNLNGPGCRASDGVSSCSGQGCYYGPAGFSKPVVTTPPSGTPYAKIRKLSGLDSDGYQNYYCGVGWYSTPQTPEFPDVTGTFPNGQGCPGGGSSAGYWDY